MQCTEKLKRGREYMSKLCSVAGTLGQISWQNLGTVDTPVSGLLWLHKQTVVSLTVEITLALDRAIILAS